MSAPSQNRFFVAGRNAARAKNNQDTENYNREHDWFKTALAMEPKASKESANVAYQNGYSSHRQIASGFYL